METTYKGEPRRFSIPTSAEKEGFITAIEHKRTGSATSVSILEKNEIKKNVFD